MCIHTLTISYLKLPNSSLNLNVQPIWFSNEVVFNIRYKHKAIPLLILVVLIMLLESFPFSRVVPPMGNWCVGRHTFKFGSDTSWLPSIRLNVHNKETKDMYALWAEVQRITALTVALPMDSVLLEWLVVERYNLFDCPIKPDLSSRNVRTPNATPPKANNDFHKWNS